ncbi:MAG: PilZ domain-containing protein [Spirochaetales bacterium]|nr:PilZ domain-containing protein [Spirochaetales bacterium]
MGTPIGRIVKEFVFKNLVDQGIAIRLYGHRKELTCTILDIEPHQLELEVLLGDLASFRVGERLQAYFFFQNNFHIFESSVLALREAGLTITHPAGVYKNPQRKYARVRMDEETEVYFTLSGGQTVSLNFPRSPRTLPPAAEIAERRDFDFSNLENLYGGFKEKAAAAVSYGKIVMLRDKIPESYEEKLLAATGKTLWVPSTEEDFPAVDPFPEERIITRRELAKYEESFDRPPHVVASKLSNILYEKQKKRIHAELYCPVIYESYLIGYVYLCNRGDKKERIEQELVEYVYDFSRVLSYALYLGGYFTTEPGLEHRYEAPVIDISASGLLFAHPREDLAEQLLIHTDLDITLRFPDRRLVIGSRVRRKFQDDRRWYYGVQFLRLDDDDLGYLFHKLYGKQFSAEEETKWEGGTPPPPLELFGQ